MYKQYYNILSDDEFEYIQTLVKQPKWFYGRKSIKDDTNAIKFWQMNLNKDEFLKNKFLSKIEELSGFKFNIKQIVANGQTFGQDGSWHYDSHDYNDWTFVFYTNVIDNISLVGETLFKDENEEIYSVKPIPNSGVIFKSSTLHKGCSPKVEFNDMRITIAYKLIKTGEIKKQKTLF
jgi:hypothetical protein